MPIDNQITPLATQPYVNQVNFGQLIGRVNGYNTNCSSSVVANLINNVVRRVYDRRNWYGLFTKGQIISPGYYQTGTVSLTLGSNIVVGNGTAFSPSMVGQQIRTGFTSPIYTITAFGDATHLTMELPWGMPTIVTTGYFITQFYYSFPNIKYFYSVKNLQMMYRMYTNVPQSLIENWDPARLQMMFPRVLATMPPDSAGNYQVELWPTPNTAQAFPYLAYVQPPNLVDDANNLPAFIRGDIIELGAIAEILIYRPKDNPNYSESAALSISERFTKQFEGELQHAMGADEALYRADIVTAAEQFPLVGMDWDTGAYLGGGGFMSAMSLYGGGSGDYY